MNSANRSWENREHFFNAAAITMRRILVDRARQKASTKHGGPTAGLQSLLENTDEVPLDERLLLIDESLEHLEREILRWRTS